MLNALARMLLVALVLAFPISIMAQDKDQIPTLTAMTDPSFPPFEMRDDESGEMVGFDMDLLKEIAERAGFEYDLKLLDFPGIIPALQTGSADIAIAGIYITDERSKIVDFSDPYYHSGMKLLVRSDSDIESLEDLDGKKVSTKIGSTSYEYLERNVGDRAEIAPYPSTETMYMALTGGAVDAVLYDMPNLSFFASRSGADVRIVGPLYEGADNGMAFPKNSEWVAKVNDALASMKADGTYDQIYKKWFGELPAESE